MTAGPMRTRGRLRLATAAAMLLSATPAPAQIVKAPWPDTLSAQARAALAANDARPPEPSTMPERRARAESIQQEIGGPRLRRYDVRMEDAVIAGVPVRIFHPRDERSNGPWLMNLHGGGFLVDAGSITENAAVAGLTGYRVIAVRYRLAPEHPFPAGVEDALSVYRIVSKDRAIGLYGTSAGAILSAELVTRLRAAGLPQPAALGFLSGSADLSRSTDTIALFSDPAGIHDLTRLYAGSHDLTDPALSPMLGKLEGWPPTLCLASARDFLLGGTADFCRRLDAAHVPAKLLVWDGLPHAFWSYIDAPETDAAFASMARFFRETMEKTQ